MCLSGTWKDKNNQLPFLDVVFIRNETCLNSTVYPKRYTKQPISPLGCIRSYKLETRNVKNTS